MGTSEEDAAQLYPHSSDHDHNDSGVVSTTADTMSTTISQICTQGSSYDEEPANWQKIVWGVSIGIISVIMVIFGGGQQGVGRCETPVRCRRILRTAYIPAATGIYL